MRIEQTAYTYGLFGQIIYYIVFQFRNYYLILVLLKMTNVLLILVCFMLIIQGQQTVFGGPVSGAACCTVCCGLGSAPFGPWAVGFCVAGCIGSVGITPFFCTMCAAAFIAPSP